MKKVLMILSILIIMISGNVLGQAESFIFPVQSDEVTNILDNTINPRSEEGGWYVNNDFGTNWNDVFGCCSPGGEDYPYHPGMDYNRYDDEEDEGNDVPVYSIADGMVIRVKDMGSLGWVVLIKYDLLSAEDLSDYVIPGTIPTTEIENASSVVAMYLHLYDNTLGAPTDDPRPPVPTIYVEKGDLIGYISSDLDHLHFEIRAGDEDYTASLTNQIAGYYDSQQAITNFGNIDPELFIEDHKNIYSCSNVSQSILPAGPYERGQIVTLQMKFKNEGSNTWSKNPSENYVDLRSCNEIGEIGLSFFNYDPITKTCFPQSVLDWESCIAPCTFEEDEVPPDGEATFIFTGKIREDAPPGVQQVYFAPVHNSTAIYGWNEAPYEPFEVSGIQGECYEAPIELTPNSAAIAGQVCVGTFQQYSFPFIADGRTYKITVTPNTGDDPNLYASNDENNINNENALLHWETTCPVGSDYCASSTQVGDAIETIQFDAPNDGNDDISWFSVYGAGIQGIGIVSYTVKVEMIIPNTWYATSPINNCTGPIDENRYKWYQVGYDQFSGSWNVVNVPNRNWGCNSCDRYFRKWFYYPGSESNQGISIHFRSDDGIKLYVNGMRLGRWGAGCHGDGCVNGGDPSNACGNNYHAPDIDITSYLHEGYNLISAHVSERAGGEYFSLNFIPHELDITSNAICCIGLNSCETITPEYPASNCADDGGIVYIGGWLDCEKFSNCDSPQKKVKSDPLVFLETDTPLPTFPAEVTFSLIDTLPRTIYYDLTDSLGGYRLYVPDFTGQVSVFGQPGTHSDTVDLYVTEYSFEAPSVLLGLLETGTNYLTLDPANLAESYGTYCKSTGMVELYVRSLLFNDIFPQSNPVECKSYIRGFFNRNTGIVEAVSNAYNVIPGQTEIEEGNSILVSDTIYTLFANALQPIIGSIYIGNFTGGYDASEVDLTTISINNHIPLSSGTVVPSVPEFNGSVVDGDLALNELVKDYIPVYDTTTQQYSVSGQFEDGKAFMAFGSIVVIGHVAGDVNNDGELNVADLTCFVNFLFLGGSEPANMVVADVNHDGFVNISDLVELIGMVF